MNNVMSTCLKMKKANDGTKKPVGSFGTGVAEI